MLSSSVIVGVFHASFPWPVLSAGGVWWWWSGGLVLVEGNYISEVVFYATRLPDCQTDGLFSNTSKFILPLRTNI